MFFMGSKKMKIAFVLLLALFVAGVAFAQTRFSACRSVSADITSRGPGTAQVFLVNHTDQPKTVIIYYTKAVRGNNRIVSGFPGNTAPLTLPPRHQGSFSIYPGNTQQGQPMTLSEVTRIVAH